MICTNALSIGELFYQVSNCKSKRPNRYLHMVDVNPPPTNFHGRWIGDGARDPAPLGNPHKTNLKFFRSPLKTATRSSRLRETKLPLHS